MSQLDTSLTLVNVALASLKPATYNPRKISEVEKAGLKSSIQEFGYVDPIIYNVRTGNIVGGHQRYTILRETGNTHADVIEIDVDDKKEKALNIALNHQGIAGTFDDEKLQKLLPEVDKRLKDILNFDELEKEVAKTTANLATESKSLQTQYEIIIPCIDEAEQESIFYRLQEQGIKCKVQTL